MNCLVQGAFRFACLLLGGLTLLGCGQEASPPDPTPVPVSAATATPAEGGGWIFASAQDAEVSPGDQFLYDQEFGRALASFRAQPASPRRLLGLGQAHLGLARVAADSLPLALRMTRDFLVVRARSRPLTLPELHWLAAQDPTGWPPSEELTRLTSLDEAAWLAEASGTAPFLNSFSARSPGKLPHPADLLAFARLHARAAQSLLSAFAQDPEAAQFREPALALAAQAEALQSRFLPPFRIGDPTRQPCLAESFNLDQQGQRDPALTRLQGCTGEGSAQELFQIDPSWLILRTHLRYQEGSCSSYALAAVDLSVLERAFPVMRAISAVFRQLYASECSVGGRLAGG